MSTSVVVNVEEVQQKLQAVYQRTSNPTSLMRDIAVAVESSARLCFMYESDPNGKAWQDSQRKLQFGGKTLIDSSYLYGSLYSNYGDDFAEAGASAWYASIHNKGLKDTVTIPTHIRRTPKHVSVVRAHTRNMNIPQRQFFPITDAELWGIVNDTVDNYARQISH